MKKPNTAEANMPGIHTDSAPTPDVGVVSEQEIAFIIGCGRTGSHMLGNLLDGPSAKVCFELAPMEENQPPRWHWTGIHAISRNPRVVDRWWKRIVHELGAIAEEYAPRLFIDKSNQLMGWTDGLRRAFPNAKFIGLTRAVRPTVRSMIRHRGFIVDVHYADSYETPNLFSGAMTEEFFDLDVGGKLVWRWKAARARLEYLRQTLPKDTFRLYHYEDIVEAKTPNATLKDLSEWLNVTLRHIRLFDKNDGVELFFNKENEQSIQYAIETFDKEVMQRDLSDVR